MPFSSSSRRTSYRPRFEKWQAFALLGLLWAPKIRAQILPRRSRSAAWSASCAVSLFAQFSKAIGRQRVGLDGNLAGQAQVIVEGEGLRLADIVRLLTAAGATE